MLHEIKVVIDRKTDLQNNHWVDEQWLEESYPEHHISVKRTERQTDIEWFQILVASQGHKIVGRIMLTSLHEIKVVIANEISTTKHYLFH